jgi:hypothetical protein
MLNRISKTLTDKEKQQYDDQLTALENLLDFFIKLTADEKKQLYKMGSVHLNYINSVFEVIKSKPGFLPQIFNMEEYAKDVQLLNDLHEMHTRMKSLFERFENTMLQLGHEATKQSDELFNNLKQIAKKSSDEELNATIKKVADQLKLEIKNSHKVKG